MFGESREFRECSSLTSLKNFFTFPKYSFSTPHLIEKLRGFDCGIAEAIGGVEGVAGGVGAILAA